MPRNPPPRMPPELETLPQPDGCQGCRYWVGLSYFGVALHCPKFPTKPKDKCSEKEQ